MKPPVHWALTGHSSCRRRCPTPPPWASRPRRRRRPRSSSWARACAGASSSPCSRRRRRGGVAPSPSEAAARFRANVGVRRVICGPGVRARRGATGATTRADIPVAPLVLPGLAPCVTRACEAAACAIMTDGVLRWCRDAVCRPAEQGGGLFTAKKLSGSSFTGGSRQRRGFTNLAHVKGTGIFAVKSP